MRLAADESDRMAGGLSQGRSNPAPTLEIIGGAAETAHFPPNP